MVLGLLKTSQPQGNSSDSGTCPKNHVVAAKECLCVLNAMDGIDGASYAKIVKVFRDDALLRKLFVEMPKNRKDDFVTNL